jgi:hypothetical protein
VGLLNLALGQLFGLYLPLAGLLVALYYYDRSRRRVVVSTLRFWPHRPAPAIRRRHKTIQQPLSLLLQLVAMLLLLLAIADPRPDAFGGPARQHVIILDTSAVMAAASSGGVTLMDQAKSRALAYLRALPAGDPVLLIEADGAPSVKVAFTDDREKLRDGISSAQPAFTALDLSSAYDLAAGTLRLALDVSDAQLANRDDVGEVAYVGPGRLADESVSTGLIPALRFIETDAPVDTFGFRSLRATPNALEPDRWDITVGVDNYSAASHQANLEFFFNDGRLGYRKLSLAANTGGELNFRIRSERPGRLVARLTDGDEFAANNEASIDLPVAAHTSVEVIGGRAIDFEPLFAAGARVEPHYVSAPGELSPDAVHVWAGGAAGASSRRAIYIAPSSAQSPVRVHRVASSQPITEWAAEHPLARGIRDRDLTPENVSIFEPAAGDEVIARTAAGPVVVARSTADQRFVVFGFDLADPGVRNHLAAPLLFANAVAWLEPDAFQTGTVEARSPGVISFDAPGYRREQVTVTSTDGESVPWVLSNDSVRFYADRPGQYRVATPDSRATLHLSLPEIAVKTWEPSDDVLRGVPPASAASVSGIVLWPWLAFIAGLLLLLDWVWFGRGGRSGFVSDSSTQEYTSYEPFDGEVKQAAPEREEVLQ